MPGGTLASFHYDGLGRRRGLSVNGAAREFLHDGDSIVQELAGGAPTANILNGVGVDEVFARSDAAGARAVLADGLGSALGLVDLSGALATRYAYEPFGRTTTSGAPSANPARFTGREDDGTGLYSYRARYYHPALQRFVSEDPLGFGGGGGANLHAYVGNDPAWSAHAALRAHNRDKHSTLTRPRRYCRAISEGSCPPPSRP
jgi:RHS repeat-associated protein